MILYHYCSNYSFHSIITEKRIRLSLLSLSNDAKEGQHIIDVVRKIIPIHCPYKAEITKQLEMVTSYISAIGFCLSEDGDVLSQWRGYADDAQGVAVGFDLEALEAASQHESNEDLIVRITPVSYGDNSLVEIIAPILRSITEHYESGKMAPPRSGTILTPMTDAERKEEQARYLLASEELFKMMMTVTNVAYRVKSPFFSEEKEWRILALVTRTGEGLQLTSPLFKASSEKLTPFINFPTNGFLPSMIKDVVLGPRNQTPPDVARLFLDCEGFEHTLISPSLGSYR
jgi:hypothetical protein